MTPVDDDLQGFKDDLNSIRSSRTNGGSNGGNGGPVGKDDVPDLGLGDGESSLPQWAQYGIYGAVAVAIIHTTVGIPVPDTTLLYVFSIGFLVLGLWAGVQKHEELAAVWARFQEWR